MNGSALSFSRRSAFFVMTLAASLLGVLLLANPARAVDPEIPNAEGDGTNGAWSELGDWPIIPIHASVLDDGRVLSFRGTGDSLAIDVWDPALGLGDDAHTTTLNNIGTNLFCTFALDNPNDDGKLLVGGEPANDGRAPSFVARYANSTLTEFDEMNNPRWYPTVTTLWDGRLLVQGGTPTNFDDRFNPIRVAEIYSTADGWTTLEGTRNPGLWATENYGWWYPKSHVTPAGKVWNMAWNEMYYLDPEGQGAITNLGTFPGTNYGPSSTSVMYDTGLVLQVGGGERGSDDQRVLGSAEASIINLNNDPPTITSAAPMSQGRHWLDATVLPDGKVLVTGGSEENNSLTGAAYSPELWDPATDTWTTLAANSTPRLYHSSTLLLPDGSVYTGGGGTNGPVDNFNGEIFYPPYLYDSDGTPADRPAITSAPRTVDYSDTFPVNFTGGTIDRVTLIKQANSTHSMSTQIFQELPFTVENGQFTVAAPDLATVATPGEYLLFLIDDNGVPSVGSPLRLNVATELAGVSGRVVREPQDDPVSGVQVDLFAANADGSRGAYLTSTNTGVDGFYTFTDLNSGCYVVTFIAPDDETFTNGSQWFQEGTCANTSQTRFVDARLSASTSQKSAIAGFVFNEAGAQVSGVSVDLFLANENGNRVTYLGTGTTEDNGYAFRELDPDCYAVTFIAPSGQTFTNGSQWFQSSSCLSPGEEFNVDATLAGGAAQSAIAGTVARDSGGTASGVQVDLFEATGDGSRGAYLTSVTTDSNGDYVFPDIEPNCYVLTFIAPQGETFTNGSQWFQPSGCVSGQTLTIDATLN